MFQIDLTNPDQIDGADLYMSWSAKGTECGSVNARSFYFREGSVKTATDLPETKGFVIDLDTLKTGWQKSEGMKGIAPEWKWNESINKMEPNPDQNNKSAWKKGFSMRILFPGKDGKTAQWEQAGAGVWNSLVALTPLLIQQPDAGKMPHVKLKEAKLEKFPSGSSTVVPILEIIKWIEKPDSLKEGAAAGIALDETPPAAKEPAPAPVMDDDDDFA